MNPSPAVHRRAPRIAATLLAVLACSSAVAMAQADAPREPRDSRANQNRRAEHRALADDVRRVERATGGEVLSAERVQSDGRDVSRVKVIDASGRVRVYMGDPHPRPKARDRTRRNDSNND